MSQRRQTGEKGKEQTYKQSSEGTVIQEVVERLLASENAQRKRPVPVCLWAGVFLLSPFISVLSHSEFSLVYAF